MNDTRSSPETKKPPTPNPSRVGEGATPLDNAGTRPVYYGGADNQFECIKVLEAWLTHEEFCGWLKGTIIKYQSRAGKGQIELDAAKSAWYARYYAEYLKRYAARSTQSSEASASG